MGKIKELLETLEEEIKNIQSSDFKVEVTSTNNVPTTDDSGLTYPDLDEKRLKCKSIETCVLYIDIRKSTDLNVSNRPEKLSRLYSSFIRSMAKGAEFSGGKVRNIVGDRLMVVFPSVGCHQCAILCAGLLDLIGMTIDEHFKDAKFGWGIGIDFGKMLVTKAGIRKNGNENANYKSLVWLGPTANIASKLTDEAGKDQEWYGEYIDHWFKYKASRILITDRVYKGLSEEDQKKFEIQLGIYIPQYTGSIYGYKG